MASPRVCRICLATNVKLDNIEGLLESQMIFLFGADSLLSLDIFCYVCYECSWMIRKFSKFKDKYTSAQSILFEILQTNKCFSEEHLKLTNRIAISLQTNISVHKLTCVNFYASGKQDLGSDVLLDMKITDELLKCPLSPHQVYDDEKPLSQLVFNKNKKEEKSLDQRERDKKGENSLSKLKIVGTVKPNDKDNDLLSNFNIAQLSLTEQIAQLEKRRDSPNYRDSLYRCDICYKGFLQAETLRNHIIRHDLISGDIVCEVCKCRFQTRRAHSLHVVRHTRLFSCTECSFVTVHIDQAKKHKQWHDGLTYKCQYCNEISNKLTSHLSHIRMKHTSEFVCDICGYSFVSDKGLKMHRTRMHKASVRSKDGVAIPKVDSSLFCKECGLQFTTKEAWKRHQVNSAKHRDKIGTACRACGETFASAARLRAHAHTHATSARARALVARRRYIPRSTLDHAYPATCEHCSESIKNRSCHWKHYQRCHQDKKYPLSETNYICEYCGKGFQANAFLVYHKRTHFKERIYECSICPKSFHTASTLRAHRMTHSTVRSHPCSLCYKPFKTKIGLQQHIKSHSGYRPFSCEYCNKSFTRASCLNLHVSRQHTIQTTQGIDLPI